MPSILSRKKKRAASLPEEDLRNMAAFSFYLTCMCAELDSRLEETEEVFEGAFSLVADMMMSKKHTEEGAREVGAMLKSLADGELLSVRKEALN